MLYRESVVGLRTKAKPYGLVAPVNVFDGHYFPERAKQIQWVDFQRFWVVGDGFSKSERYLEFQDVLRPWANEIARVILHAPDWQSEWIEDSYLYVDDADLLPVPPDNFNFVGLE